MKLWRDKESFVGECARSDSHVRHSCDYSNNHNLSPSTIFVFLYLLTEQISSTYVFISDVMRESRFTHATGQSV
jgi:hypothetical protein